VIAISINRRGGGRGRHSPGFQGDTSRAIRADCCHAQRPACQNDGRRLPGRVQQCRGPSTLCHRSAKRVWGERNSGGVSVLDRLENPSARNFTSDVAVSHARVASRWRAAPLPGGGRTLWIASKGFRLHFHSPFQDFSCRKGRLRQAAVRRTVSKRQDGWAPFLRGSVVERRGCAEERTRSRGRGAQLKVGTFYQVMRDSA